MVVLGKSGKVQGAPPMGMDVDDDDDKPKKQNDKQNDNNNNHTVNVNVAGPNQHTLMLCNR